MPVYRPDIHALTPYEVGRPIEVVARELGMDPDSIVRLTSNESPEGPFPGVVEAVAEAAAGSRRYPDPDVWSLSHALAAELGVDRENLLFGAGSVALLGDLAMALGGPGTNAVYGWPSFVMYRFVTTWAMAEAREVPLNDAFEMDLDEMHAAIDAETTIVYLCNPNNPTGTIRSAVDIEMFVRAAPSSVLIVIDEAYHEFVTDDAYASAIPLALELPNVVVVRTFSKVFSLAAHRIGYAVGQPETLVGIRKAQTPLSVNQLSQVAAEASLGQQQEIRRRAEHNDAGRHHLMGVMVERGLKYVPSHTNFVFFKTAGTDSKVVAGEFTKQGVIIRPMSGGWVRVTVGTPDENKRFVSALDQVLDIVSE